MTKADGESSASVDERVSQFTHHNDKGLSQGDSDADFTQLTEKRSPDNHSDSANRVAGNEISASHISVQGESIEGGSTRRSLLILVVVFLAALGALSLVYSSFPKLDE